jgi:hypothetical protein
MYYTTILNVMVEWLALLHIWEVFGSNIGLGASYHDRRFLWFSLVPPGK